MLWRARGVRGVCLIYLLRGKPVWATDAFSYIPKKNQKITTRFQPPEHPPTLPTQNSNTPNPRGRRTVERPAERVAAGEGGRLAEPGDVPEAFRPYNPTNDFLWVKGLGFRVFRGVQAR